MSDIYKNESKEALQSELLKTKQLIEKYKAKVLAGNLEKTPDKELLKSNKDILAELRAEKEEIEEALKNK